MGVPFDVRPWILLNEYPSRSSIEDLVFISPEPDQGFDIKVRGKRIQVKFKENLPPDRTVVVTFGSGIRDINGNQMAESFILAFSTGEKIDRSGIRGQIVGMENPSATWVWGYPLESFEAPDPRQERAPFATQPDLKGNFTLSFLPSGNYRLFAVTDSRRNRLWDSDKEVIAFPPQDVLAAEDKPPVVNLKLGLCDLEPPSLRGAQVLHRQAFRLSFDEPVNISDAEITASTVEGRTLSVIDFYYNPADSAAVLFTTAVQREGDVYQIQLDGITDRAGNRSDSIIAEVKATVPADTSGPHLTWYDPENEEIGVDLDKNVEVGFSEAVILTDLPRAITLLGSDSTVVVGKWSYPGSARGVFEPAQPLLSNTTYCLRVRGDSLRDIFGNRSPDSLAEVRFTTLDLEEVGSITGQVAGAEEGLHVAAEQFGGTGETWETVAQEDGRFSFDQLPAANYRFWLYRDVDGNAYFTPGRFNPFTFAEPFAVSGDTIRVRSRWETEGIKLFWGKEEPVDSIQILK